MIMVGSGNPTLYTPAFLLTAASPVGTVMSTQTRFSIQGRIFGIISYARSSQHCLFYFTASVPLRRTLLNGTYITIRRLNNNAIVRQIDCKYSPDVYFQNTTLIFFVPNPTWILGVTYYIQMSQGVATAAYQYCGTEAAGFTGKRFSKGYI